MGIVTQKTQSPQSIDIDGVPHRQCGEGRKQRRAGAMECGEIYPVTADYWPANNAYTDGFGIVCLKCRAKQQEVYTKAVSLALVPVKVYDDVPIGSDGRCRGVSILVNGVATPHLVVKEACRYWGLDSTAQLQRIQADPNLLAGLRACKMQAPSGAFQPSYALRYDLVPLWLAGVETGKMRDKERATQLAAYQKVCGQVLADYFFGTQIAPPPPADRIQPETAVISSPDMHVMEYIDNAFAKVHQALSLLPGIDTTTRKTLTSIMGASRIEIEVPAPVIKGDVYFGTLNTPLMITALQQHEAGDWGNIPNLIQLLSTDWVCFIFGESKAVEKRLLEHAGKNRIGKTKPICPAITTDAPKDLEKLFRDRKPSGVMTVPNTKDLFVIRQTALHSLIALPHYMTIKEAKARLRIGWIWEA